jgi:hypothetical protein
MKYIRFIYTYVYIFIWHVHFLHFFIHISQVGRGPKHMTGGVSYSIHLLRCTRK